MRPVLWTILLIVLAGTALGCLPVGDAYTETIKGSFTTASGASLRVEGRNGSITVKTWDGSTIAVEATKRVRATSRSLADQYLRDLEVTFTQDGDDLHVTAGTSTSRSWGSRGAAVSYLIQVPRGWQGDVALRTSNGSIDVDGIDGTLNLRSSNGRIAVRGHEGLLQIQTSNGRIELEDVKAVINARTSNGRINVQNVALKGTGELRTSNGRVYLAASLDPAASYVVRTSNGTVDLRLTDPNVRVDMTTSRGSINVSGMDMRVSQMSSTRMVGTLGQADAQLEVRTSNGGITLQALR